MVKVYPEECFCNGCIESWLNGAWEKEAIDYWAQALLFRVFLGKWDL